MFLARIPWFILKQALILLALASACHAVAPLKPALAPFRHLTEDERDYYDRVFSYAMETQAEDQEFPWKTYASYGIFMAKAPFESKQGTVCRPFQERFTIGGESSAYAGFACRRVGEEGWCKLKEGDFLSCALSPRPSFVDQAVEDAERTLQRGENSLNTQIGQAKQDAADVKPRARSFWDNLWPF